ncbi:hypothetical protein VTI74DRAFT_847 [Chaetomium olivicolor]
MDNFLDVNAIHVLDNRLADKAMFRRSFDKSRMYFQLLELLREMRRCIRDTRSDLEDLRAKSLEALQAESETLSHWGVDEKVMSESADRIRRNWDSLMEDFSSLEGQLLKLINTKEEDIRDLRDGVMKTRRPRSPWSRLTCGAIQLTNAHNLLEASRATSMNRYIIIFTVVTIFYLPLGFVTAVFSMDLLHEEELAYLTWPYGMTMLFVSVATYVVAMLLVAVIARREQSEGYAAQFRRSLKGPGLFERASRASSHAKQKGSIDDAGEDIENKETKKGSWSSRLKPRRRRKEKDEQTEDASGPESTLLGV